MPANYKKEVELLNNSPLITKSKSFALDVIKDENELTMIEIETNSNAVFIAVCSCTDIKVEWNKYCDRAWYEKKLKLKYDVVFKIKSTATMIKKR